MDWSVWLNQLDQHAGAIQAVAGSVQIFTTVVLVVITVYYAFQTRAQVRAARDTLVEMQTAREAESAPFIVAYFDVPYGEWIFHLVVRNIGRLPAQDTRIEIHPSVSGYFPEMDPTPEFLLRPIPFLPPQYELRTTLWTTFRVFANDSNIPRVFTAHIKYVNPVSLRSSEHEFTLDVNSFFNLSHVEQTTLQNVDDSLKMIAKELSDTGRMERIEQGVIFSNKWRCS